MWSEDPPLSCGDAENWKVSDAEKLFKRVLDRLERKVWNERVECESKGELGMKNES